MTQKARIFLNGKWQNCRYLHNQIEGGQLLRVIHPVQVILAFPEQSQSQTQPTPAEAPIIQTELAKRLNDLPTLENFISRAKNHAILGTGKHWQDILELFKGKRLERAFCEQCGQPVTVVTAKYCSKACKQASYRERKARNKGNNTERRAA